MVTSHSPQALYADLREVYPEATVWFTGHSLGGSLASLLALDAGAPAFCYEAPGTAGRPTPRGSRASGGD